MNEDIHMLSGAYAIDAVDDVERAQFERHLEACKECREEVDSLRGAATQLSLLFQTTPPERMREQVLQSIAAVRPLPPRLSQEAGDRIEATSRDRAGMPWDPAHDAPASELEQRRAQRHAAPRRRSASRWFLAAAAVVAIGGGATVALHPWDRQSQSQLTVAQSVIQAPDAQRVDQTLADGATTSVVRSKSVGKAVLVANNLPAAPDGKVYQLWLQNPQGAFVSAGFVPPRTGGGTETVVLQGDAVNASGAGISVEPSGGSRQPTTTPIALYAFA